MDNFLKKNALAGYKVLYSLIIFLGAFLTFMFQPVVGKILTPQYGGGADIWASCLLFFQFVLFAGYLLALLLNKLKPKVNAAIYAILFILAVVLFKLPTEFGSWLINLGGFSQNPLLSLFASLFKYAMLPVLVLSTVSVSMQNWYTRQTGESPYILYSISNIGSFLALFLYPLIYEPLMTISATVKLWHNVFVLLVLLIVAASVVYFISFKKEEEKQETKEKIQIKNLLYWIALSAAGTVLLASYTTFVTVRILPMPMLWTLFLGLYLLTFVLCFGSEKFYKKDLLLILVPVFILINIFAGNLSENLIGHPIFSVIITAAMFFIFLMICNVEIYKTRPQPSRLSEFYLAIAFGGVLGGFFVNIIAPLIFNNYIELPLINIAMYIFAVYLFVKDILNEKPLKISSWIKLSVAGILTIMLGIFSYVAALRPEDNVTASKFKRNFYGTIIIKTREKHNIKTITSGNTLHGAQIYDIKTGKFKTTPLTYFTDTCAFAYAIEGLRNHQSIKERPLNKDRMTFYEIDPKMYEAAKNEFTYLKDAKGKVDVQMGDARIVLDKKEPQNFDILLIDAFSSDSIPVHLITKEAFSVYKKHIKDDGMILFHISNRYLNIDKMLKKLMDEEGLKNVAFMNFYKPSKKAQDNGYYKYTSKYFVIFMPENKLYKNFKGFKQNTIIKNGNDSEAVFIEVIDVEDDKFLKPFTDDYSSLVRIFKIWSTPENIKK